MNVRLRRNLRRILIGVGLTLVAVLSIVAGLQLLVERTLGFI
jgi:hypothetical protein